MNKNKIYIGLGIIMLVVLGMGGFFIFQLQRVSQSFEQLEDAEHVITDALNFNVENFHTQLEMWEYAFDPNETRLIAFRKHRTELNDALGRLVASSRERDAIFDGGVSMVDDIRANVGQVNADWERMLSIIAAGDTGAIYDVVVANEELFDRLRFNQEVDELVKQQDEFVGEIEKKLLAPVRSFNTWLFAFIALMFVLITGIGMWMSASVKKEEPIQ